VRAYLVEHLGDPGAVSVIDETGDLEKGTSTVGVQRQYTGTAGRVENAQVAVYLVYASSSGHAIIDRELYLPRAWTCDPDRCRAAGVPDQVGFATKPTLATQMLTRTLDAGVPAAWVTGDEVYGADPALRAELEARGIGYVLAVACGHRVVAGGDPYRADALLGRVPARAWQQVCRPARAPKATAGTTGRSSAWTLLGMARPGSTGCWSAATSAPGSWPSTAA
jgi:SRSO17 transposase